MADAVVVDFVRTPSGKGKPGGTLAAVHPVDLLAETLRHLLTRNPFDHTEIDDVIAGCVTQAGEQSANIARHAALAAGIPPEVPAMTVDRQCGSSQQAVHIAAQAIISGCADVVLACGVESMSRAPMLTNVGGKDRFGQRLLSRYPEGLVPQGISAELVASRYQLTREDLDLFAAESHRRAAAAWAHTAKDILPVNGTMPALDETIRPSTSVNGLAGLRPAFVDQNMANRFPEIEWKITAGNSSPITDGASAALLMSAARASSLGLTPRARVHTMTVVGDDPILMLTGVVPATRRALSIAGLSADDIDLYEVNEAFASVPLAWQRDLDVESGRLNVHGGAIALGHPLGASGTRIAGTLIGALEERNLTLGLQTMCEAGGMANATIFERI
jgi:acetyl-CoA acyltransferase